MLNDYYNNEEFLKWIDNPLDYYSNIGKPLLIPFFNGDPIPVCTFMVHPDHIDSNEDMDDIVKQGLLSFILKLDLVDTKSIFNKIDIPEGLDYDIYQH